MMNVTKLLVLILLGILNRDIIHAQKLLEDSLQVVKHSKRAPFWKARKPHKLHEYLTKNVPNKELQDLAVVIWITNNIKYDVKGYENGRPKQSINKTLKRGKGVCSEYSDLYHYFNLRSGINNSNVIGYIKEFDLFPEDTIYHAEHEWSINEINDNWYLSDLTWASGYVDFKKQYLAKFLYRNFKIPFTPKQKFYKEFDPHYIKTDPTFFAMDHLPTIRAYQLLNETINDREFISGELKKDLQSTPYIVNHKASAFYALPQMEKWKEEYESTSITNKHDRENLAYLSYFLGDMLVSQNLTMGGDVVIPEVELLQLQRTLEDALQNQEQAKDDFKFENDYYKARSKRWRDSLKKENKEIQKLVKNRISLNNKEARLLMTTQDYQKMFVESFDKKLDKSYKHISEYRKSKKKVSLTQAEEWKKLSDSLAIDFNKRIDKKDSMWLQVSHDIQSFTESAQDTIQRRQIFNDKVLKITVLNNIYAHIHLTDYHINKMYYRSPEESITSIQKTEIYPVVDKMKSHLSIGNREMRKAISNQGKSLRYIVKCYKKSPKEFNEEQVFDFQLEALNEQKEKYAQELSTYLQVDKSLLKSIKKENKSMNKALRILMIDLVYENLRHEYYANYRLKVKEKRQNQIKPLKAYIKDNLRLVNRAIKELQESKKMVMK